MKLFKFNLGWFCFNLKEVISKPFYFQFMKSSNTKSKEK